MEFRNFSPNESRAIVRLFSTVFARSEGEAEGILIARLARDLLDNEREEDRYCYVAAVDGRVVGCIIFSRLIIDSGLPAFILSPVAVHDAHQGKGTGRALINYGLAELKKRGVSAVFTYGDPDFYRKVGFGQLSQATMRAPFELSQPQGWLGQSLSGDPVESLSGSSSCVAALNDPVYW